MKIIIQIALISYFLILFSGCGHTTAEFRQFYGQIEELKVKKLGTFRRVKSTKTLLEIFVWGCDSFPRQRACSGYSIFIEASPEVFQPGKHIIVPNKNVNTYWYADYHHAGVLHKNLTGNIKIIDKTKEYIFADINLRLEGTDFVYRFKEKFPMKDITKYNLIEH